MAVFSVLAHKMMRSQVHVYTQQQLINNGNLSLSPFALL